MHATHFPARSPGDLLDHAVGDRNLSLPGGQPLTRRRNSDRAGVRRVLLAGRGGGLPRGPGRCGLRHLTLLEFESRLITKRSYRARADARCAPRWLDTAGRELSHTFCPAAGVV